VAESDTVHGLGTQTLEAFGHMDFLRDHGTLNLPTPYSKLPTPYSKLPTPTQEVQVGITT